jgi:hypothetical protein
MYKNQYFFLSLYVFLFFCILSFCLSTFCLSVFLSF